jgi:neutral ceramidase
LTLVLTLTAVAQEFSAGVAAVDITPPVGYRMAGYFVERLSTGTLDPLLAKALVLREGDERVALVFCDLVGVPVWVTAPARKAVAEKTGIPAEHIIVVATHSHTGPLYYGALREYFHKAAIDKDGRDPREEVDYAATLTAKIVEAITKANASLEPVSLSAGQTPQSPTLSFNRRYFMKDGSVKWNPGVLNPEIVKPAGPIDPEVGIVALTGRSGKAAAVLTVFALHCDTTRGTLFSGDFPYYLDKTLRQELGPQLFSLFGNGTCGNVNHIDVSRKEEEQRSAADIGPLLGRTVSKALPGLSTVTPQLRVESTKVHAALQKYDAEQVAAARKDMPLVGHRGLSFLRQVEATKILSVRLRKADAIDLEVQAIRLGPQAAIVALPSEMFAEFGLAIKKASPFRTTLVIELANDSLGYIPTREAFAQGAYEPTNSNVQPGTGEMLTEAAIRLLKKLGPAAETRPVPGR